MTLLDKDYWGYLEMGARRSELTQMFLELDKLVWPLAMQGNRPSDQTIADPRMRDVRQMAARILRALERVYERGRGDEANPLHRVHGVDRDDGVPPGHALFFRTKAGKAYRRKLGKQIAGPERGK